MDWSFLAEEIGIMNDLERYFYKNKGRVIHKWVHYFDIYDRHFSKFRKQCPVVMEIGVSHGGSLQMWRDYFGKGARIIGVDINPACREMKEEGFEIFIGSQEDRNFLQSLKEHVPRLDVLIDDGGHTMQQQIVTFEELFDHVKDRGVYLCEDLHTSYWPGYGGGLRKESSFIEYSKSLIDRINADHSKEDEFRSDHFTRSTGSLHYYDSVFVIEKHQNSPSRHVKTGSRMVAGC